MLTSSDLLHLPYHPRSDRRRHRLRLPLAGLHLQSHGRLAVGPSAAHRGGVAVELAFRRYLGEQAVPFDVLGATPFTDPDQLRRLAGRTSLRCEEFPDLPPQPDRTVRRDPGVVLQAPALVPLDQFAAEGHKPDDLYLFAFLLGVGGRCRRRTWKKPLLPASRSISSTRCRRHGPDPSNWIPLEKLALKSECETPITVEIGGQDAERDFVTATAELPPKQRMPVEQTFYSLAYVHAAVQARGPDRAA